MTAKQKSDRNTNSQYSQQDKKRIFLKKLQKKTKTCAEENSQKTAKFSKYC